MEEKLTNPDIRYIKDLRNVLYDKKWAEKTTNFPAYYMYRGIKTKTDLRYDITIIPFQMFGKEFPKTKGHFHPHQYGEIYIVMQGKAFYLLQNKNLSHVVVIKAEKGEIAIIPPGYGHITINPGKEDLKMANWVNPCFISDYTPIEEKKGASYFYTTDGWVTNKNYTNVPKIDFKSSVKKMPSNLDFVKGAKCNPHKGN